MHEGDENLYRILVQKFEGERALVIPGIDGRLILELTVEKWNVMVRTEINCSG
jgi:hypothetical protein